MLDTPQTALNVFNAAYIEEQKTVPVKVLIAKVRGVCVAYGELNDDKYGNLMLSKL